MHLSTHVLTTILLLVAQPNVEAPRSSSDFATVSHAVVSVIDQVQVPARQAGVLEALELEDGTRVQEGVSVQSGQLLGKLDDRDAIARQRAAELDHKVAMAEEGKSHVAIEAAEKTVEVAAAEYEESLYVNTRAANSIPDTQLRRQKLTEERARAEQKVSLSDSETAGLTVMLREAQIDITGINLDRHTIRSPLDGEVVQVVRHVGEWVNPGDPIMRIVRLDRLRVEGYLELGRYRRHEIIGQPVTVNVGSGIKPFEGTISYVSPLIQANGDYRVWCEVDNRRADGQWELLPGMDAEMTIRLKK